MIVSTYASSLGPYGIAQITAFPVMQVTNSGAADGLSANWLFPIQLIMHRFLSAVHI